jgi:phosphate uptake regulator
MFRALLNVLRKKNQLSGALDLSYECLEKAELLARASIDDLLDGKKPELDIYALDREINRGEMQVRRLVFEYQLLNEVSDLTAGLVLTSTIIDIERIGDYAKNIYELAERYRHPFAGNRHFDTVRNIAEEVLELFPRAATAFREGDVAAAEFIMKEHSRFGRRLDLVLDDLVADPQIGAKDAVMLALSARYTKRISAHLSNLASSVVNPFDRIGFRPDKQDPEDAD